MSKRAYTLHPLVSKLFIDVVRQLLPELASLELSGAQVPRFTFEQGYELLDVAVQLTGRADLGVLAAEAAEPGHFELIELACRTQSTVGEAIETLAPLWAKLYEGSELLLEHNGASSRLTLRLEPGARLHPVGCDFTVVSLLTAARRQTLCGDLVPERVFLPYARPAAPLPLARVLPTVAFEFDQPRLGFEFSRAHLGLPLVRADASMGRALREVAEDVLVRASHTQHSKLERDVRERLRAALPAGDSSAAAIARQLHISERTLRRRLEADGLSLRALTDQVRHELALSLLSDPKASTDEVATQLGFSTAQAFHRAFRRWTGLTVQAYRARQRSG